MTTRSLPITLNGDPATTAAGSIEELLAEYGLQTPRVAVILNGEVVPKADFPARRITQHDTIDIITIIGGG